MAIETYLYHFENAPMDFTHYDAMKNYPSLQATNGMLGFSMVVYLVIAWGMPFDWVFRYRRHALEPGLGPTLGPWAVWARPRLGSGLGPWAVWAMPRVRVRARAMGGLG